MDGVVHAAIKKIAKYKAGPEHKDIAAHHQVLQTKDRGGDDDAGYGGHKETFLIPGEMMVVAVQDVDDLFCPLAFGDLEQVMPYNVRLVSVRPQVTGRNEIQLEMVVGSQTVEPVIDLMRRLEQSPVFGGMQLHNSIPPSQSEPLMRYRISVNYAQKL